MKAAYSILAQIFLPALLMLALSSPATAAGEDMRLSLQPGEFRLKLQEIKSAEPERIIVVGNIDIRDLQCMADSLPASVAALDLSASEIVSYSYPISARPKYGTSAAAEIPQYIFAFSSLRQIVLPQNIRTIAEGAFAGAEIESISFPSGLVSIADYAFADCAKLTSAKGGEMLRSIGKGAFSNCSSLTDINLNNGELVSIGQRAFAGCSSLAEVEFPERRISIGSEAFANTAISSLKIPYLIEPQKFAFASMQNLESVDKGGGHNAEGEYFADPQLKSLEGTWNEIPALYAASSEKIKSANILLYATEIGDYALAGIGADTLFLGSSVNSLKQGVFFGMKNLKIINAVRLAGRIPEISDSSFYGILPESIRLIVDGSSIERWKEAEGWNQFKIEEGNDAIGNLEADAESGELSVRADNGIIIVNSSADIESLSIYTPDGKLIYSCGKHPAPLEVDLSDRSGILLIDARDKTGNRLSVKLLL